ncbi:MAG TPA: hypothetical protein VLB74_08160 [Flavobacterium sp.]|uniref:hypothetical protein n=1 Tax=Flavobacterium sp. TaxID=239 RepID=UPI002B5E1DBD|nr:hypothetical protein [Flavobacterium sp.]HSD14607.1 hypothetical protein [Flavobacterium sp.]
MRKIISLFGLQDSDLNDKKLILAKIILIFLCILSVSLLISMFVLSQYALRYGLILFIVWLVSLMLASLIKRNNTKAIASIYISFLLIMILLFSLSGGGIKAHGIKLLPIVVLFAGLTMGKREIWIFGIIAALVGLFLVFAEQNNLLPRKEPLGFSPIVHWTFTVTSIFLLCFLENLSVETLRKALIKSKEELGLRIKSEETLKLRNEKLVEIAQFQSHMVRGPVASIEGLISLINFENPNAPENFEIIQKLKTATENLDSVVNQIVKKTDEINETQKEKPNIG